jgi:hypothetical protein
MTILPTAPIGNNALTTQVKFETESPPLQFLAAENGV